MCVAECLSAVKRIRRAAGQPAAVHRHGGRPVPSPSCLLPGPPGDGENSYHHVPGENTWRHESLGGPPASREQHVCKVIMALGHSYTHWVCRLFPSYSFISYKKFKLVSSENRNCSEKVLTWVLPSDQLNVYTQKHDWWRLLWLLKSVQYTALTLKTKVHIIELIKQLKLHPAQLANLQTKLMEEDSPKVVVCAEGGCVVMHVV